jgi:Ser/Thr protein kinase RdoA (MazF antagonist)
MGTRGKETPKTNHPHHAFEGVIHGDFHTQNILVTLKADGTIKKFYVIDFGQGMFKKRGGVPHEH